MLHLNRFWITLGLVLVLTCLSSVARSLNELDELQRARAIKYADRLYARGNTVGGTLKNAHLLRPTFYLIREFDSDYKIDISKVTPGELLEAGFDPAKNSTTFLVHGFTQSYPTKAPWMVDIVSLYRKHGHLAAGNLIVMDWSASSNFAYLDAAASLGFMGEHTANLIELMVQMGTERHRFHLIGHSLGAHLSGYTGRALKEPIGRITGLDPAGPGYKKVVNLRPDDHIEWQDADEVNIYHYDDNFLGMPGEHGTNDVFVNGGLHQPDCPRGPVDSLLRVVGAKLRNQPDQADIGQSHARSVDATGFALSATGCQQVAYECASYEAYLNGECGKCDEQNNRCFLMGFEFQYLPNQLPNRTAIKKNGPTRRRKLYISTGVDRSFCRNHYQIIVSFPPETKLVTGTKLTLNLKDENNETSRIELRNQLRAGQFTHLLTLKPLSKPGKFVSALLEVQQGFGAAKMIPMRVLIEANFMSNIDPDVRKSLSSILRPAHLIPDTGILSRVGSGSFLPTRGNLYEFKLSSESPACTGA